MAFPDDARVRSSGRPGRDSARSVREVMRSRLRDPRIWLVQVLVLAIFIGNELFVGERGTTAGGIVLDIAVESLFLVPILYAALNFGVAGSLLTGAWVSVLMMGGDIALDLGDRRFSDAGTDAVMVVVLDVVAIFVGWRMAVEQAERDRYWDLFESNAAPVLIVDSAGTVTEANAAARRSLSFGKETIAPSTSEGPGGLPGVSLAAVVGPTAVQLLAGDPAIVTLPSGTTTFRAVPTRLAGRRGESRLQVVLENLTEEMRREYESSEYARCVLRGQEEERRRVAQELHDGPVQRLVQLCRQLDIVDEEAGVPLPARSELASARDLAELVVTELREILRGLRPPALEHLGLVPTLRRALDELSERSGISATLALEGGQRRLEGEIELTLFRIGQEALNNIERHASATAVRVLLGFARGEVSLIVRDNGVGFEPGALLDDPARQTFGLRNMAERAQLIGGELEVRSQQGRGTEIRVVVPRPAGTATSLGAMQVVPTS